MVLKILTGIRFYALSKVTFKKRSEHRLKEKKKQLSRRSLRYPISPIVQIVIWGVVLSPVAMFVSDEMPEVRNFKRCPVFLRTLSPSIYFISLMELQASHCYSFIFEFL